MRLFALQESKDHGRRIAASMGQDLSELEHRDFEDGEYKIRPLSEVRGDHVCIIQSLYDGPDLSVHDKLCRLLFLVATMRDHGATRVTAVVPYLCYGRKDRRTKPQDPITTRYIAQLFEAVSCDDLITLEAHNLAAFHNAFRLRTHHLNLGDVFQEIIATRFMDTPLAVMSPDPGGVKRAQLFREALQDRLGQHVGFGFMEKRRSSGIMTSGDIVGDFKDKSVLIVDDMIVSGGTMAAAANACKARGAVNTFALAAHGLFMPGAASLFDAGPFETIFVSDSIPPFRLPDVKKTRGLEVVNTANEFARALRAIPG